MSSGPDNITQTTRTSPSPYLTPAIETAANSALGQFTGEPVYSNPYNQGQTPTADTGSNLANTLLPVMGRGIPFGNEPERFGIPGVPVNPYGQYGAVQPTQPPTMGGGISEDPGGISLMGAPVGSPIPGSGAVPGVTGGPAVPPSVGVGDIGGVPQDPYALLEQRGRQGSPLVDEASDLLSRTMGGEFLDPSTNPWLESTFNRAADLTRTRLDSEFAGSGRNLGAAMPARSQELQTLANSLYGQNYARERGMQQGAINAALPFAANDFTDINAVLDAQNLPLDTLINRISALAPAAGGTAMSSQPLTRNQLGAGIGGAASLGGLGAALGATGPVGWGLAGLGGLLGLLG